MLFVFKQSAVTDDSDTDTENIKQRKGDCLNKKDGNDVRVMSSLQKRQISVTPHSESVTYDI